MRYLITIMTLMLCSMATAETYRWTDENGKLHFSDTPPPSQSGAERMDIRGPDKIGQDPDVRARQQRALETLEAASKEQRKEREQRASEKRNAYKQECRSKRRELHRLKHPTRYGDPDDVELSRDELDIKEARALELARWLKKNCFLR